MGDAQAWVGIFSAATRHDAVGHRVPPFPTLRSRPARKRATAVCAPVMGEGMAGTPRLTCAVTGVRACHPCARRVVTAQRRRQPPSWHWHRPWSPLLRVRAGATSALPPTEPAFLWHGRHVLACACRHSPPLFRDAALLLSTSSTSRALATTVWARHPEGGSPLHTAPPRTAHGLLE